MSEKNFSLVVELQADIEKFVKGMDNASKKNRDFGNKAKDFNKTTATGFAKVQGKVTDLTGVLSGLGGTAGMVSGSFSQLFGSITKGGGAAGVAFAAVAASVGLVSKAIQDSKRQMEAYSKTLTTMQDGAIGFNRAAREAFKTERDIQKGRLKEGRRSFWTSDVNDTEWWETKRKARGELREMRGLTDRKEWQDAYNTLLQQEMDLKIKLLDKELEWKKIDAERAELKRTMSDTDKSAAERQAALNEYTVLTNQKLAEQEAIYTKMQAVQQDIFDYASSTYEDKVKLQQTEAKIYDLQVLANNELREADEKQRSITNQVRAEAKAREDMLKFMAAQFIVNEDAAGAEDWMTTTFYNPAPKDYAHSDYLNQGFENLVRKNNERLQAGIEAMKDSVKEGLDEVQQLVQDSITNIMGTLFEGIGAAMVNGSWDSMFSNVLAGVGEFMSQMGALFVSFGVASEAFQALLGNIENPAAAIGLIAAGAALMMVGGAIKATASSYGGGSGYSGGGAAASSTQGNDFTVRFEIAGDKLVGVTENYNRKQFNTR